MFNEFPGHFLLYNSFASSFNIIYIILNLKPLIFGTSNFFFNLKTFSRLETTTERQLETLSIFKIQKLSGISVINLKSKAIFRSAGSWKTFLYFSSKNRIYMYNHPVPSSSIHSNIKLQKSFLLLFFFFVFFTRRFLQSLPLFLSLSGCQYR